MSSYLSNTINYCRNINGSKGFNDTKTQLQSEMTQDYNIARPNIITRFSVIVNTLDGKDVYINDSKVPIRGVIDTSRKQSADTEMQQKIQVYPNQIKRGDYVKFKVNETDEYHDYIITSDIDKKNGYDEGIFKKCNYTLKWIMDGKYYETPSIVTNNTKYTLGIKSQSSSGLTEADGMFGVIISYNDIVKKIPLGKRFIVNGQAWEVTQLDHSSVPNVLSILLGETSKVSENDDLENEIADRWVHNYTISLNSTSQSIEETSTYQLNPVVKDNNQEISNENVVYESSNPEIATVDKNGLVTALKEGNCVISCSIGEAIVDLALTIIAKTTIPITNYTTTWTNNNGALLRLMSSTTVTCVKTIDGIEDNLVVNYTLDSISSNLVAQKKLTITKVSDASYTIKNTNTNTTINISIEFIDASDGTVIEKKNIQLKGV